jgi:O-antigen/teichoic acid export membrane protein
VRGAIANFSVQPLTWGASLLLATTLPRFLGSQALGQFSVAVAIIALASTALSLGVTEYLTRRVARKPEDAPRDVAVAVIVQTVAAIVGVALVVIVGPLVAPPFVDFRLLDVLLVGLVIAPLQTLLMASLRGREQHGRFAWLSAMFAVLGALGSVAVLFAGGDVVAFAAVGVLLSVVLTSFNWWVTGFRISLPAFDRALLRDAREFVRGGLPFLSWNITLNIYGGVDRLLLGAFVSTSEIGWYAASFRIIGVTVFIPTVLTTPLFPALSRSAHQPETFRRAIAETLRIALLSTVPLSTGLIVVAPEIPRLLGWPDDFSNAIPLMMILSLHLPIVAVDMILGTAIMALGREARWVQVGLLAAVFNVGINVLLIPATQQAFGNGAIGASIVTVLTEVLMLFGALALMPRNVLDSRVAWLAARIVVAAAATAAVGMTLLPIALPLAVVGGALTYVILAWVLRVVTLDDVQYVRARFSRGAR